MMRLAVLLAGLSLASAADTGKCGLNGARAVDDLMDASVYIWASVQRCQKPKAGGSGNMVLCAMDISAAIESVNAMVNVILNAVEDCGDFQGENEKCGLAVGQLTRSFAGLAAASAGVTAKCEYKLTFLADQPGQLDGTGPLQSAAQTASFGQCLVDAKDTVKSLFKVTSRLLTVKENCDGDDKADCAHNALKIVAAFAGMGECLAGAVGRCSLNTAKNKALREGAQCGEQSMELVRHLHNVGRASIDLHENCNAGAERLYELEHGTVAQNGSGFLTIALAALLPIAAVLSFVVGSRFAKVRVQPAREHESLVSGPEVE